jgi:hypothetical protein
VTPSERIDQGVKTGGGCRLTSPDVRVNVSAAVSQSPVLT